MTAPLNFTIAARDSGSHARVGRIETPHGAFDTPAFMPVGTRGAVKGLTPGQVRATGSQIILGNAYHLMLRPGAEQIAQRGGLHVFMRWNGPVLTDSGGYQAFSMADINRVDDDGVTFRSIIDGAEVHLGPESSMAVQNALGADIIMAFDDCPPSVDPKGFENKHKLRAQSQRRSVDHVKRLAEAHERTVRWLDRCITAHARASEQSLFGIVQGGTDLDLRRASVEAICNVELPGYAIGGVAVGEGPGEIRSVVDFTAPLLPDAKPRYLMGVGYEHDLLSAVRAGVDMFDCVLPTRNGRNANVFTRNGRLHLRNARFSDDDGVIETGCDCYACTGEAGAGAAGFSRAYLRHLFHAGEMLGPILASIHNIRHFQRLMLDIRQAIRKDAWSWLEQTWPVLGSSDPERGGPGLRRS